MSLNPGDRLGPYEILSLLGMGGMGEVYRARDTNLARDVALKVVPDAFALDPDRLARFRREAQMLATLNHPNIAAIYGFEESHRTGALVLELVEGATLADRLVHGALPLNEAWPIAQQIADALEAAHDHGIIHRDLKPSNIKLRADGTVKVLDFGLAKAFDPTVASSDASQSPTLMSPAMTRVGVIVGTASYMSPEQARGRAVDKRADVWAYGCVLYEMLTAARAFPGDDVSETIARVIEREPDWSALAKAAPPSVVRLVRRCLQKDPRNRLRDISDARLELQDAVADVERSDAASDSGRGGDRAVRIRWPMLAAVLVLGIAGGWLLSRILAGTAAVETVAPGSHLSTEINLPGDALLALDSEAANIGYDSTILDLSPDGRTLVWVGSSNGTVRLFARQLDSFEVRPLAGTEGALHPFFSPDGRAVGFLTNDKVKTYSFTTGTTTTICDVQTGVVGTWTSDDLLFFGAEEGRRLMRVSAHGGTPALAADAREGYRYGRVTPDGKAVLVTYRRTGIGADFAEIRLVNLATKEAKTVSSDGYDARLTRSGYLIFGRSGRVFATRLDRDQQRVVGEPVSIASGVRMHALYPHLQLAVSDTGVLVYVPGADVAVAGMAWVNRQGQAEFLPLEPRVYGMFDLSDDGRRLAAHVADTNDYILIYDVDRQSSRRLPTTDSAGWPKWSPNGEALAYTSFGEGKPYRILIQQIDSDRPPVVVAESQTRLTPSTWSADGHLTFYEFPTVRIGSIAIPGDGAKPSAPQYMSFSGSTHDVSPDGHWLAYADAGSGINVRALPAAERVQKISDTGTEPRWCRKCNELVYRNGNRWFSAQVSLGPVFDWKPPRLILQTDFNDSPGPSWVLSADGQRILVVKGKEQLPKNRLRVIHGWLADLAAK